MPFRILPAFTDKLKSLFKTSGVTLKNILVLMLVFGLERIFEKDVFKCPRRKHFLYGSLFLFCPAVCLFSLTLLLNAKFWEVLTGCRLNRFHPRWVVCRASSMTLQALLTAGVWIVVALVQTNYYVCARLGPKEAALQDAIKQANGTSTKEIKLKIEDLFSEAETESHIIAWILFVSIIISAFIVVCIKRCWFRRADGILLDMEDYDKLEAEAAAEYLEKKMEEIAKEEGEKYVENRLKGKEEKSQENRRTWVSEVVDEVAKMYPRMTGNLSEPYKAAKKEDETNVINVYELEPKRLHGKINGVIESSL